MAQNIGTLKSRHKKVAFMGITKEGVTTYKRMTGFTSLPQSKNPQTYDRQYVDEETQRSDVLGYAPEMSYAFDLHDGNEPQEVIVNITDKELIGADAIITILVADLDNNSAIKREFSVVPDSEGDDINVYSYSGTFKSNGDKVFGTAASSDQWATATFTEKSDNVGD